MAAPPATYLFAPPHIKYLCVPVIHIYIYIYIHIYIEREREREREMSATCFRKVLRSG